MKNFNKLVSVAEQIDLSLTQLEIPKTDFLSMWPILFGHRMQRY